MAISKWIGGILILSAFIIAGRAQAMTVDFGQTNPYNQTDSIFRTL